MWLAKILPVHCHPSDVVASTDVSPTVAELMKQRETAIENMVASIAAQDFRAARWYSYEENRSPQTSPEPAKREIGGTTQDRLLTKLL